MNEILNMTRSETVKLDKRMDNMGGFFNNKKQLGFVFISNHHRFQKYIYWQIECISYVNWIPFQIKH